MSVGNTPKWYELRCWYSDRFKAEEEGWRILYNFKRNVVLPILEQHRIDYFLTLDEPDFVLFRIEVDSGRLSEVEEAIRDYIERDPYFSRLTVVDWSPEEDARGRILWARERAKSLGIPFDGIPEGGWRIKGSDGVRIIKRLDALAITTCWVAAPDDLERKVGEFARFMGRIAGRFTRAYLKEIPEQVDDRWLLSVFIHLLLNSISVWKNAEEEARAFPYL